MAYFNGKEIFSFGIGGTSGGGGGGTSQPHYLPVEVSTEAEMNALLLTAEIGAVYKYVGASTATYESGQLYIVEVVG